MTRNRKSLGAGIGWSQKQIAAEKARAKAELDQAADPKIRHSRLHAALERLDALVEDDTDLGRLRRYILAVSALVQHERSGGLTAKEVSNLVSLSYAILQAQGVRPRASKLASLFSDIHQIRSQIFRKDGNLWRAAWEQQVALQLAGEFPSGGLGLGLFAMANRALRLGHARLAMLQFAEAETHGVPDALLGRCRVGRVQALWLAGKKDECAQLSAESLGLALPDEVKRELEWGLLCRDAQTTGDLNPLLKAIRRGEPHHEHSYIIEACFWAWITEAREFLERLPSMASMKRHKDPAPQRLGLWFEGALTLQECYDRQVPLPFRLRSLSHVLDRRHELLTVDKELLFLAAATRFLARSKSSSLAVLVFSEYRALSQRLTDGRSEDALGLLVDLRGRPWLAAIYPPPEGSVLSGVSPIDADDFEADPLAG